MRALYNTVKRDNIVDPFIIIVCKYFSSGPLVLPYILLL